MKIKKIGPYIYANCCDEAGIIDFCPFCGMKLETLDECEVF